MKIKLLDHTTKTEDVEWGTCELCAHIGPFDFTEMKFQADDGSGPYWVKAWEYDWDGPNGVSIDNMFDFADWLARQDFYPGAVIDYKFLRSLVFDYYIEEA